LPPGWSALGNAIEVDATSLATATQVHSLGEPAQVTFSLPQGISTVDAAAAAVYHWDDSSGTWVAESSATNPDETSITAIVNHFSQFIVASNVGALHNQAPAPPAVAPPGATPGNMPPSTLTSWADLPVNPDGEIPALRNASSTVYRTANGGFQRRISAGLLNYKDASGVWQRIDTTLIASGTSGEMRNTAGPLTFSLPATAGAARVDASGASLTMSIRGASRSPRIASGSSASYASALPGIDASYRVTSTGLDESLLVQQRPTGPLSITYDLATTGLALSANADGSVNAFDASGGLAFLLPAPWMMETPGGNQRPGPPNSNVAVSLTGGAGRYQLTYTPDQAWLQDPARRYPLTLDPSVTINPSLGGEYDSLGAYIPGSG
jgi:hypothetical protein